MIGNVYDVVRQSPRCRETQDWSGARDLNPGPHGPRTLALSGLGLLAKGRSPPPPPPRGPKQKTKGGSPPPPCGEKDIGIGARLRRSVLLDSTLFTGIAVTLPATKSVMRFGPVWFGADRCTRGLAAPHGQTGLSQWPRPMRGLAQCSTPSQLPQHLARCALFRPSPPCDDGPPDPVGRP